MKRVLAVLLSLAIAAASAFLLPLAFNKQPQPWSVPQSQVKLVKGLNGNCSGVVVAPGYVLTAKHCAELQFPSVDGKQAKIVRAADNADLLLLAVDVSCPCAKVGTDAAVGEHVIAIGYPMGDILGYTSIVTEGISYGIIVPGGDVGDIGSALLFTAVVDHGNSGGGAFVNHNGIWYFVGIVVAGSQSTTLAVSLDTVKAFLGA